MSKGDDTTELKNFHTHTLFCDGKNSAEEVVEAAIEKGFTAIGFSGHSYTSFDLSYCMTEENTRLYIECINRLKEKYRGKIRIYLGLEADYYAENIDFNAYDFIIGSVHYIKLGSEYLPVDHSAEWQKRDTEKYFGGSFDSYCEAYFSLVSDVAEKTHADLIGHFDLVTKFNENDCLFSTVTPRYRAAWQKAVDKLLKYGVPFEINAGAIARGRRIAPYPSAEIARYITEHGGKLVYSSDCHNKDYLDCAYDLCTKTYGSFGIVDFEPFIKSR